MKTVAWSDLLKFQSRDQMLRGCEEPKGWRKAISYWKPESLDEEVSIPMILESNGLDDAIWALCAFKQDYEREWWLFKADVAELALPIFEKQYPENRAPRECIEGARLSAGGKIGKEELKCRSAAAYEAANLARVAYNCGYNACRVASSASSASSAYDVFSEAAFTVACDASYAAATYTSNAAYVAYKDHAAARAEIDSKIKDILLKYFGE